MKIVKTFVINFIGICFSFIAGFGFTYFIVVISGIPDRNYLILLILFLTVFIFRRFKKDGLLDIFMEDKPKEFKLN